MFYCIFYFTCDRSFRPKQLRAHAPTITGTVARVVDVISVHLLSLVLPIRKKTARYHLLDAA